MKSANKALLLVSSLLLLTGTQASASEVRTMFQAPANNGVKYWIEMYRGNTRYKTNHRTNFKNNDRLRFHVTSNIDGYAYLLLLQDGGGNQAVIFPSNGANNNRVSANKEIVIPSKTATLDIADPKGVEKLRLVFSRTAIDPNKYLDQKAGQGVRLASTQGAKSVVPDPVKVEITTPETASSDAGTKNVHLVPVNSAAKEPPEVLIVSSKAAEPLTVDVDLVHQ